MTVITYLHSSKESMYDVGQQAGLSEEALKKFIYALYEVKFTLDVNAKTGDATIMAVDGKELT